MQAVRNITTVKDETIVTFIKHEIQLTNDETDRKYDVSFGRLQKYFFTLSLSTLTILFAFAPRCLVGGKGSFSSQPLLRATFSRRPKESRFLTRNNCLTKRHCR